MGEPPGPAPLVLQALPCGRSRPGPRCPRSTGTAPAGTHPPASRPGHSPTTHRPGRARATSGPSRPGTSGRPRSPSTPPRPRRSGGRAAGRRTAAPSATGRWAGPRRRDGTRARSGGPERRHQLGRPRRRPVEPAAERTGPGEQPSALAEHDASVRRLLVWWTRSRESDTPTPSVHPSSARRSGWGSVADAGVDRGPAEAARQQGTVAPVRSNTSATAPGAGDRAHLVGVCSVMGRSPSGARASHDGQRSGRTVASVCPGRCLRCRPGPADRARSAGGGRRASSKNRGGLELSTRGLGHMF